MMETSLAGPILQGIGEQNVYNYQAQVARINSAIYKKQEATTLIEGQNEESAARLKTGLTVGAMKAAQGANNIAVDSGSATDVRASAEAMGEVDALTIRYNAARRAYGYGMESRNQQWQSELDKYAGKMSLYGGIMKGISNYMADAKALIEAGAGGG